uniref:GPS domain-containing protein n=1 Tax=Schistosoma mansoni TaxID=6183 RepID=A0A5K4F395_SCHMA
MSLNSMCYFNQRFLRYLFTCFLEVSLTKTAIITVSSTLTRLNKPLEWNDSLLDPNSDLYRDYSTQICDLLLHSINSTYIKGIINVTCTVVGFSRGSVIGNAMLVIDYSSTSENFSSAVVTEDTVRNAVVEYIAEIVANGSDQIYFGTSSGLTIETVIDAATTEMITESQDTEAYKTTGEETTDTTEVTTEIDITETDITETDITETEVMETERTTAVSSTLTRLNKPLEWNDSLLDPNSDLYRDYSTQICDLGIINVTCTVVGFSRGSVIGNAMLVIDYSSTSENFSSAVVTEDTVRNAVVEYIAEIVANGSDQIYFGTSSGLTIETVIDAATTEMITESQDTEAYKTTGEETTDTTEVTTEIDITETDITETEVMETERTTGGIFLYDSEVSLTKTAIITVSSTLTRLNKPLEWNDSLLDPNSDLYRDYSTQICDLLLHSINSTYIKGIINVTCTVVGFSRGSVIGNAMLVIDYSSTSENFSSAVVTEDTVRNAVVEYIAEIVANGSDQIYFGTSSGLTIETVIDAATTEMITESQDTEAYKTTGEETTDTTEVTTEIDITETDITETEVMETERTTEVSLTKTAIITVSSTLTRLNKPLEWNDSLLDPNSDLYRDYSTQICDLLLHSINSTYIKGIINVTCTVVGFSRGSVIGNAMLVIDYSSTSENFSSAVVTEDTVRNAVVEYIAEIVANGSDQIYFGTSSGLTIETVIDAATTEMITESQDTEAYKTTETTELSKTTFSTKSILELSMTVEILTGNQQTNWNSELSNKFSGLYNSTGEKICTLIKASPRYITSVLFTVPTCTVLRFYPGSVKSDVQIIVEYINNLNVTQTQILQAIQLGSQLYVMDQLKNQSIDSSRILSFKLIMQKETCSTIAAKCSPHAQCIERSDGAICICNPMWVDLNVQQPGEQCISTFSYVIPSVSPSLLHPQKL